MGGRERWDWLDDLVELQLGRARADEPRGEALVDALGWLGLAPAKVIEGVAAVLGLTPSAFAEPDARSAQRIDPDRLALLLPVLIHDARPQVSAIAHRWLRAPTLLYQLAPNDLVHWLETDEALAKALAPTLKTEALAILGPARLLHLKKTAHPAARQAITPWLHRLR